LRINLSRLNGNTRRGFNLPWGYITTLIRSALNFGVGDTVKR
jgi:hypothetical protein